MENKKNPETVFLCSLTHDGKLDARMAGIFFSQASKRMLNIEVMPTSLLASGCNKLWCKALNTREKYNIKWFAMLHADIIPEPLFVDKLIAIAEKHEADVLSAVVPIKGPEGLSSTALSSPDEFQRVTRLTMKQIHSKQLHSTFDRHDVLKSLGLYNELHLVNSSQLLVNTGCMVVRMDQPWCADVDFTIRDRIRFDKGNFIEEVEPEDWYFSRRVAELGGKVMATREVVVEHVGTFSYRSNQVWGMETDPRSLIVNV